MSKRWLRPVVVAVAAASAAASACGAASPTDAATITNCVPGTDTDKPRAVGEVRNASSKRSSFFIRIEFHDSDGNRLSEGLDTITDVEPGATEPFEIQGVADARGPVTCEVATVRRTAAPGA